MREEVQVLNISRKKCCSLFFPSESKWRKY